MALPNNIKKHIESEAIHASDFLSNDENVSIAYLEGFREGYKQGGKAWAERAQKMAQALEKLNNAIDKTWNECNTKSIPDKYKKEISVAQAFSYNALSEWKGEGKEVIKPEHNVSIGEWITYCDNCGFPIDECNCVDKNTQL